MRRIELLKMEWKLRNGDFQFETWYMTPLLTLFFSFLFGSFFLFFFRGGAVSYCSARAFSYWMANNAPFSEGERLKLLKMDSVLERLLYIDRAVTKLVQVQSDVCCGICGLPLCPIEQIFVVRGAEGTTSNYVNGHGFIHQITTVRDVCHRNRVSFRELPSTENSYFPGYSWWITCCNHCGNMLGWKFQKVAATDNNKNIITDKDTPERPAFFFGFMASNVNVAERRRPFLVD